MGENVKKILAILVLLSLSSGAWSQDVCRVTASGTTGTGATPEEACTNWGNQYNANHSYDVIRPNETTAQCRLTSTSTGNTALYDIQGDGCLEGCPEGATWNPQTLMCDAPVECDEEPGTFAGWQKKYSVCVIDGSGVNNCDPKCKGNCATTWNGATQYDLDTDSTWGVLDYTGETCSTGGGGGGGEPDEDQKDEIPPADQSSNDPPDSDGDGIPDIQDSDMDGDGIPNGEDSDTDGDGVADGDDPSPNGQGNGDGQDPGTSQAAHSDNCSQRPSCKGDAIQCAQLYEMWRFRCLSGNEINLDGDGEVKGKDLLAQPGTALEDAQTEYAAKIDDIKNEASQILSISVGGSTGTIGQNLKDIGWGNQGDFSWFRWQSELAVIGYIILAVAAVMAAMIILGD